MLAIKVSAGFVPEVNLRNGMWVRKLASKESTLALKSRADITRGPKQGYQWLLQFFLKRINKDSQIIQAYLSERQRLWGFQQTLVLPQL